MADWATDLKTIDQTVALLVEHDDMERRDREDLRAKCQAFVAGLPDVLNSVGWPSEDYNGDVEFDRIDVKKDGKHFAFVHVTQVVDYGVGLEFTDTRWHRDYTLSDGENLVRLLGEAFNGLRGCTATLLDDDEPAAWVDEDNFARFGDLLHRMVFEGVADKAAEKLAKLGR